MNGQLVLAALLLVSCQMKTTAAYSKGYKEENRRMASEGGSGLSRLLRRLR
jgi:hypothetical protein